MDFEIYVEEYALQKLKGLKLAGMHARLVLSAARRTLSPGLHRHWRVGCRRHSDLAEAAVGLALDGVRAEGGAVGVVDTVGAEHALAARDRGHGAAGPGGVGVRGRLGEVVAVVPGVAVVASGSGRIRDGHGGPHRVEGLEVKDVRELRRHVQEAVVRGAGSCSARGAASPSHLRMEGTFNGAWKRPGHMPTPSRPVT